MQFTGFATLKIDGDVLDTNSGASLDLGGLRSTMGGLRGAMAFLLRNGFEIKDLKEMPLHEVVQGLVFLREEVSSWQN